MLELGERLDDLGIKNLKIYQNDDWFCFGIDAVLLANYARNIKKNSMVLDLGTGTGIIPTLLCGKTELKKVIGVEIQEEVCEMAKKSIEYNKLQNRFEIICDTILNLGKYYQKQSFDVVITNPPYKKQGTGLVNPLENKSISRHEITANLDDFIRIAKDMLKDNGEFYMIHHPERLVDILSSMRENKLEPKELRFICSKEGERPKLVLIKGVKNAKAFLKIQPNLYIYEKDGNYTQEILLQQDLCCGKEKL